MDGPEWRDDAAALLAACRELRVPGALERSRSGNGAHLWVFFTEPVAAALARKLGSLLLTRAMETRPEIGLRTGTGFKDTGSQLKTWVHVLARAANLHLWSDVQAVLGWQ
jgi:hypothetical protein